MQFTTSLIVALLAATTNAANKANEYASGDCSGPLNYGHNGVSSRPNHCINMDITSHSVYHSRISRHLTAYSKPGCQEIWRIGGVSDQPPCKNLDIEFPGVRIGSVKFD